MPNILNLKIQELFNSRQRRHKKTICKCLSYLNNAKTIYKCNMCQNGNRIFLNNFNANLAKSLFIGKLSFAQIKCSSLRPVPQNGFTSQSLCCIRTNNRLSSNLQLAQYFLSDDRNFFTNFDYMGSGFSKINGLGCMTNRSLTFLRLDSNSYQSLINSMEVKLHNIRGLEYGALIIDLSNELYFNLYQPMHQLGKFNHFVSLSKLFLPILPVFREFYRQFYVWITTS